jgi:hypothetical protein
VPSSRFRSFQTPRIDSPEGSKKATRSTYRKLLSVGRAPGFVRVPLQGKERVEANPRGFGPQEAGSEEGESPLTTQYTESVEVDQHISLRVGSNTPSAPGRMSDRGEAPQEEEAPQQRERVQVMVQMPLPGKSGSPQFTGKKPKEELRGFLDEFEYLADEAGLDDQEKKQSVSRYVSPYAIRELWKAQPEYQGEYSWDEYKHAILAKYPEVEEKEKYTVAKMNAYVEKWRKLKIRNLEQFGEFDRGFDQRIAWLEARGKISEEEKERLYWHAFPKSLKGRLEDRIIAGHPDLDPDDEYTLDQIRGAVKWVLKRKGKRMIYESESDDSDLEDDWEVNGRSSRYDDEEIGRHAGERKKASSLRRDSVDKIKKEPEETNALRDMIDQLNIRSEKDAAERRKVQSSLVALHQRLDRQEAEGASPINRGSNNMPFQRWEGQGGSRSINRYPESFNRSAPMFNGNNPPRFDNSNRSPGYANQMRSPNVQVPGNPVGYHNSTRPIYCAWCGSNAHSKMYCDDLKEALAKQEVIREANSNNLLLPTGVAIPRGEQYDTLKDRVRKAMAVSAQYFESYFQNATPVQG